MTIAIPCHCFDYFIYCTQWMAWWDKLMLSYIASLLVFVSIIIHLIHLLISIIHSGKGAWCHHVDNASHPDKYECWTFQYSCLFVFINFGRWDKQRRENESCGPLSLAEIRSLCIVAQVARNWVGDGWGSSSNSNLLSPNKWALILFHFG